MRIDLHTHSNKSDGTDTPAQLLVAAAHAGLDVIGLTDHDTIAGWNSASANVTAAGVALVRGAEVSCSADGVSAHMLSYLHNPQDSDMNQVLERARTDRITRLKNMTDLIAADFPITWDEVVAQAKVNAPIGRPHLADALIAAGCFADRNQVFEQVLHPRHHYYVHQEAIDPVTLVEVIRHAGGVPVFAHPRPDLRQRRFVPYQTIKTMAAKGLFGLEVAHRDHTGEWRAALTAMAKHLNLEELGSSDYHGAGKTNQLGEHTTSEIVFMKLAAQGKLEVLYP